MSHTEQGTRSPKAHDPLTYWLKQESESIAMPTARPARLVAGWWILPLVGSGALLWVLLVWVLLG